MCVWGGGGGGEGGRSKKINYTDRKEVLVDIPIPVSLKI